MQNSNIVYATLFMRAQKIIKEAQVLFFAPPMIPGYSVSTDIELNMQDKTGGSLDHFYSVVQDYMAALEERPEITSAATNFNPSFPQYQLDIDAAACKRAGIKPNDILSVMQGYYGGLYASNFNSFGKMYRVMIQGERDATKDVESLESIKVRNEDGEMAPVSQFVKLTKVYGPDVINRFNLYTSMKVMVAPATGYTSGQALQAIAEVAEKTLPAGFGYELGGMAREEAETSGSTTGLIFVLCFVFVYLLLSAQYESYILPLAVLLSVPFGLMGSFIFVNGASLIGGMPALQMIIGTMSNNIYMQIALIMLMGRAWCRCPSASYLDDITGHDYRSAPADVCQRCRCQRLPYTGYFGHRRYVNRYDSADLHCSCLVRCLPVLAREDQTNGMGRCRQL